MDFTQEDYNILCAPPQDFIKKCENDEYTVPNFLKKVNQFLTYNLLNKQKINDYFFAFINFCNVFNFIYLFFKNKLKIL